MGGMTREQPRVEHQVVVPDYDHLTHCDPKVALCGATDIEWSCPPGGVCGHPTCPLCVLVEDSGRCPYC